MIVVERSREVLWVRKSMRVLSTSLDSILAWITPIERPGRILTRNSRKESIFSMLL
ncbi:MAG: hypothetical protein BWY86_01181 [Candidatus Aminicenantes bacterium ADurb.Bin508]|nr:MAG: hypothetical protein BWY86_01181 [Candidatus Aminicenantes bacterium ADurb.Bin508]